MLHLSAESFHASFLTPKHFLIYISRCILKDEYSRLYHFDRFSSREAGYIAVNQAVLIKQDKNNNDKKNKDKNKRIYSLIIQK